MQGVLYVHKLILNHEVGFPIRLHFGSLHPVKHFDT